MCPTSWCVRVTALARYKKEYSRVRETLHKIIDEPYAITTERKVTVPEWLIEYLSWRLYFT